MMYAFQTCMYVCMCFLVTLPMLPIHKWSMQCIKWKSVDDWWNFCNIERLPTLNIDAKGFAKWDIEYLIWSYAWLYKQREIYL